MKGHTYLCRLHQALRLPRFHWCYHRVGELIAVLCCGRRALVLCWGGPGSAKIWGVVLLCCPGMSIESADVSMLISMRSIAGCLKWME